ncbi:MAG: type IX secretion system outer membrane channel protein PorV [Paludibacteraceae bacterium]|nr:type IX secretion system outer membrane channel protein PorV [Paludibacteraceae bacterium]MBR6105227.1 type IX secretion system outer membrane channel protein PorV [Paludibacteraceae bacterium]
MKNLFIRLGLSAALLSVAGSALADEKSEMFNPLQSAVPSLSIAPDARGGGMGDIGVATSPDLNSQYWNLAKYAQMSGQGGASLSYTPWLRKIVDDIYMAYLAGYYKLGENRALSASLRYFSYGDIELTSGKDAMGNVQSIGSCRPYEFAVDLGYSMMLSEYWSAGVALRFIYSDITNGMSSDGSSASAAKAIAADLGAYYRKPIALTETRNAYVGFGASASNIGSKVSYDDGDTEEFLPANLRVGGSFEYPFDDYSTLTLAFDLNKLMVPTAPVCPTKRADETKEQYDARVKEYEKKYEDYQEKGSIGGIFRSFTDAPGGFSEEMDEIMWSLGLEYAYNKQFFVRGGYFHEAESKGNRKYFSVGAGFKLSMFELNGAYLIAQSSNNPLDQTLRFSLGFNIDGLKKIVEE